MSDVTVRFRGDTRQLERSLANVNRGLNRIDRNAKQSRRALQGINSTAGQVTTALRAAGAALIAFGTGRTISGIVGATTAMEGFRTQLTTYLGSQEMANTEIARLSKLARSLPQDVNQLTEAFVIFQRFGIDTSNESMKAFSNIAAANSKSITQLGEAVADALTGEFERLKEFGIKVTKENNKFVARIGEDQVAMATSASQLVDQLKQLGEEGGRFGNVTVGALTLALSNFRGAVFEASAAIGDRGFGLALAETVNKVTDFISGNDELITKISRGLTIATLAAGDAFMFLLNNIEMVMMGIGAFMALGIVKFLFSIGSMIISMVVPAVMGLLAAFRGLAKFIVGGLIRGAIGALAIAFGKITLITGAVAGAAYGLAKAWDWAFGTSMTDTIDEFAVGAKEKIDNLVSEIADLGGETFDAAMEFTNLDKALEAGKNTLNDAAEAIKDNVSAFGDYGKRADEILSKSVKLNKTLSDQEAEQKRVNAATQANIKLEENRVAKITASTSKITSSIQNTIDLINIENQMRGQNEDLIEATKFAHSELIRMKESGLEIHDHEIEGIKKEIRERKLLQLEMEREKKNRLALQNAFQPTSDFQSQVSAGGSAFERLNPALIQQRGYEEAMKGLEIARNQNEISEQRYLRTIERLNIEHNKRMLGIRKDLAREQLEIAGVTNTEIIDAVMSQMDAVNMIQQGGVQAAQGTLSAMGNILGQMAGQNKKAFEAYKAVQIAQALISTYSAATKALAFPPGPPVSFLYVAGAIAAGMAQVNAIKSQQYTGRQLGGPVSENTPFLVGETGPEIFTPSTSGRIDRLDALQKQPVEINFTINAVDTQGFDELLVSRRGVIQQVISDAMLESGQRSRF